MTMRAMVVRREGCDGEADRRWKASARDASLSQRRECGTWFLPLSRPATTAADQVDLPSVLSTIAHADRFVLLPNELRQNRRKSAENDRPALAPTGPVGIY